MTPGERIKQDLRVLERREPGIAYTCKHILKLVEELGATHDALCAQVTYLTRELAAVQRFHHLPPCSDLHGLAARESFSSKDADVKTTPRPQRPSPPPFRRHVLPGPPQAVPPAPSPAPPHPAQKPDPKKEEE
jgi:hypothetical protein